MNNAVLVNTINIENSRKIQNREYTTRIEINDKNEIKNEYEKTIKHFNLGVLNILGGSKSVNLYLDLLRHNDDNYKAELFINEKSIARSTEFKRFITIDNSKAEIPFDKIKRIDFYIYSKIFPASVMVKYTVLFTDFTKAKIKVTNRYPTNYLRIPYFTHFSFIDKKSSVDEVFSIVKLVWNNLPFDEATQKIASVELYNLKSSYFENQNIYSKTNFMNIAANGFTFKPFITSKMTLDKKQNLSKSNEYKQVFDFMTVDNFTINTDLNGLDLVMDNTISKGILIPKKFNKDMFWTISLETDFFVWDLTYIFENDISEIEAWPISTKRNLVIMELEVTREDFVTYEFEFPLERYDFFIKQENWDFSWFVKKEAYIAKWN